MTLFSPPSTITLSYTSSDKPSYSTWIHATTLERCIGVNCEGIIMWSGNDRCLIYCPRNFNKLFTKSSSGISKCGQINSLQNGGVSQIMLHILLDTYLSFTMSYRLVKNEIIYTSNSVGRAKRSSPPFLSMCISASAGELFYVGGIRCLKQKTFYSSVDYLD